MAAISDFMIAKRERRFPVHIELAFCCRSWIAPDSENVRKICGRWTIVPTNIEYRIGVSTSQAPLLYSA